MHRVLRIACVVLLALLIGTTCGCTAQSPTPEEGDIKGPLVRARDLGAVEIREYEGKPLRDFKALPDNSFRGPQSVDLATYRLVIDGAVRSPQTLTYADVLSHTHYQKLITLHCVDGWSATGLFEGVLMKDLLAQAGPLPSAVTV
ncbi:MAG: molybdopterin-dependent oxidoreductase, partial [Caldiserica bacterium]|nr:molybdopterin-dependent oxidoreductase [Caldisericota bacterium]